MTTQCGTGEPVLEGMAAEAVKGELESEKLVVTHCVGQGE
jgi:hypothetical protein